MTTQEVQVCPRLLTTAVFFFLGLITLWWDPLGIGTISDQYSQKMFYSAIAPLYPNQKRALDKRRDDVVVVLFDNEDLKKLSENKGFVNTWPISYKNHASMIKSLTNTFQPRAILWDIYFEAPRRIDTTLQKLIKALKRSNTYLVAGTFNNFPMYKVLSHDATYASSRVYPDNSGRYWLKDPEGNDSVAYALYKQACLKKPALPSCSNSIINSATVHANDSMSIWWGANPPDQIHYSPLSRLPPWEWASKSKLYPFKVLHARELFDPNKRQRIKSLLQDSIVLFGADLKGGNDLISSPLHQLIPGVLLHAMALDNLIRMGTSYTQVATTYGSILGSGIDKGMLSNLLLWSACLVVIYFLFYWKWFRENIIDTKRWLLRYLIITGIISIIIVIFSGIMFYYFHYEPANALQWIGLGLLLAKYIEPDEKNNSFLTNYICNRH